MLMFNCTDCIFSFYYRIQLFWSKMQSENSDDFDVAGNDTAKRVYTSKGGTPGKPTNKSRRISRVKNSTSSRTLFQSPETSPKV